MKILQQTRCKSEAGQVLVSQVLWFQQLVQLGVSFVHRDQLSAPHYYLATSGHYNGCTLCPVPLHTSPTHFLWEVQFPTSFLCTLLDKNHEHTQDMGTVQVNLKSATVSNPQLLSKLQLSLK